MTWSHSMSGSAQEVRNGADLSFRNALANHNTNEQAQSALVASAVEQELSDVAAGDSVSVSASGHAQSDGKGNRALYLTVSTSEVTPPARRADDAQSDGTSVDESMKSDAGSDEQGTVSTS